VVLVVDMLVGFLEPGHDLYCGDVSRRIVPNVRRLLERERAAGSAILFICDNHEPDDLEFQMFPVHCVKGTDEAEVIPELREFVAGSNLVPKNRYSGFFNTGLEERLRELSPEVVIVCGVCTDICVLHTAADARNRDYPVEVPTDCVASFALHAHEWALRHIEKVLGARLVKASPA
jgi:nicotinamidase-related amidase